jgi:hypothetical protein
MSFNVSSPVTGSAQTGLTSPTYTVVADTPPTVNSKQYAVTALGGTQTGVTTHSVAAPFTVSMFRPPNPQVLAVPNAATGVISRFPKNTYKVITRKGVLPLAGQPVQTMIVTTTIDVPAGADTADAANVRAALSAHIGSLSQQSAGVGDTSVQGIL